MTYIKETFEPLSLEHAKDIVLSRDPSRPDKFEEETDFLVEFIEGQGLITSDSLVLDFGCGMGRVSKKLVETFGCKVIGTDISKRMLMFAEQYVHNPDKFQSKFAHDTCDVDVIIAALVLQHVEDPEKEIKHLYSVLKPGGHLVLLNEAKRFVPIGVDKNMYVIWNDDGIVINEVMSKYFTNTGFYHYCNRSDKPLSVWKKIGARARP